MPSISSQLMEQIVGATIGFLIVGGCLFVLLRIFWVWFNQVKTMRSKVSPPKKLTLFDVRELLLRGQREAALKVYRQIFKTDYKTALSAIEDLERSLHKHGGS